MKNQDTPKQRPDDLPAFVEKYFSHLQFAPQVPKEFHTFLKGHLNAFALTMRAQYRPQIMVAESDVENSQAQAYFKDDPERSKRVTETLKKLGEK